MIRKIFISLLFFFNFTQAQSQNKPLVKIGEEQISTREFKLRYELSPYINTSLNEDSIKYHFLYSLIAEKLFALEATKLGMRETEEFRFYYSPLEKMYVRDALFTKEIKDKIKIDGQDILEGITRFNMKLNLIIYSLTDSSEVFNIYNELESGVSIDSVSTTAGMEKADISFGMLKDKDLEDRIYSLSIGSYTLPTKTEEGWFLFYLVNRTASIVSANDESTVNKVRDIIKNRRIENAYSDFMKRTFEGVRIEADKELFEVLSENIFDVLNKKRDKINSSQSELFLDEADFEELKAKIRNNISEKTFFYIEDNAITVNDFLAYLFMEGFSIKSPDRNQLNTKLSKQVKSFIQKEYLTNLGYEAGLQNSPEVKEQLEMWKENYLAQMYKNTFLDSSRISEKEVKEYFLKIQKNEKIKGVNIIELLTDSLEVVANVLNRLEEGEDFRDLAKKYTKREWTKNRNAEFGLFPVTMHGEIGRIANEMKIGDIYGPVKVDEGYSVFKLIEIKETDDSVIQSFEEIKEKLKNSLAFKKFNQVLTEKTIQLAEKYEISINDRLLKALELLEIKMFVHRFMGFGGRTAAVPFTNPWYHWIYLKEDQILP